MYGVYQRFAQKGLLPLFGGCLCYHYLFLQMQHQGDTSVFILGFSVEVSEWLSVPFLVMRLTLFVTVWNGLYGPVLAEEAGKAMLLQAMLSLWWVQEPALEVQFTENVQLWVHSLRHEVFLKHLCFMTLTRMINGLRHFCWERKKKSCHLKITVKHRKFYLKHLNAT